MVSRSQRRAQHSHLVAAVMDAESVEAALDLFELVELAWHDCYGEVSPPAGVVDDILVLSRGTLAGLVTAAHLAVTDWRDARVAADELRG